MQKEPFLELKLAIHGTVNNTDDIIDTEESSDSTAKYFPIVKAELDKDGWVFWSGTEKGFYLVEADRVDNDVVCWVIMTNIVLYLMSEHSFGKFEMGGDGDPKTREQCRADAIKYLRDLGYKIKEKGK